MTLHLLREPSEESVTRGRLSVDGVFQCSRDVLPRPAGLDLIDARCAYAEIGSNGGGAIARQQSRSNQSHVFGGEDRFMVPFAAMISQAGFDRVADVPDGSGVFQVFAAIVVAVAVLVVHVRKVARADERLSDEAMDLGVAPLSVAAQHDDAVPVSWLPHDAFWHWLILKCAPAVALDAYPRKRFHAAKARHFVKAFVSSDRAPFFHGGIISCSYT